MRHDLPGCDRHSLTHGGVRRPAVVCPPAIDSATVHPGNTDDDGAHARTVRGLACSCRRCSAPRRRRTRNRAGRSSGTVKDGTGGIMPGVTVVIVNTDTSLTRTVTTDPGGRYVAADLPPGPYSVKATMEGFTSVLRSGITMSVGQRRRRQSPDEPRQAFGRGHGRRGSQDGRDKHGVDRRFDLDGTDRRAAAERPQLRGARKPDARACS